MRKGYLVAALGVVALAALGLWNPRDHVAVTLVLRHPVVASVIVVGLLVMAVAPGGEPLVGGTRRRLVPVVVVVLAGGLLYAGDRHFAVGVDAVAVVAGTDLEVSVRRVPTAYDEVRRYFLFVDQGKGLFRRRMLASPEESRWAYPPDELRASLVSARVVRVEWLRPWEEADPLIARWDLTMDRDLRNVESVEMTDCFEVPC